jgi:rhamnogalacturonan endolyase
MSDKRGGGRIVGFYLGLMALLVLCGSVNAADDVRFTVNGESANVGDFKPTDIQSLVINNGLLKITFGKDATGDFSATSVIKNGQELAHNLHGVEPRDVDAHRSFYLDSNAGKGHLITSRISIIQNTPQLAHFAVIDDRSLHLEHHFVMLKGESGIHPYVIIKTAPGSGGGGEMRTMYRFDMDILDWAWTPEHTGKQPKYALLQSISERGNLGDETWRLPDGSIYQKYDYSLYYSEAPMWGHYGHGFGVFFIPTNTESYAGGPLRQELAVHQDALILNYLGGGHYGGGGTAAGRNGQKIHGPWYLYFNSGATPQAIIADAKKTAEAERAKWPYTWVDEPLYPLNRTTVTGQIKISHDRSAAYAYVILGQPGNGGGGGRRAGGGGTGVAADRASALYTQAGDYIYYVKADADGRFTIRAIRPGTYTLYAWETQGPITQSLAKDGIEINGDTLDLGNVDWDPPYHPNLLWQIGKPDRMAGEFKLGNLPRTNQLIYQVPNDLTFTIGKSKDSDDWYFAQHGGTWAVSFDLDKAYTGNAYLAIAIAGGVGNVAVAVNGHAIGDLSYGDDASVRRAANRSGRYGRNEYTFPASLMKQGTNILSLRNSSAGAGGGLMYDTLVMEAD